MYDFSDILAANKAEQIRAWSVEQAVDLVRSGSASDVVATAAKIEEFVKNGKTD